MKVNKWREQMNDYYDHIDVKTLIYDLVNSGFKIKEKIETPVEYCPHCNANLRGEEIPEDIAHNYSGTHWGRKIGIYDYAKDRIVEYMCPDCNGRWMKEI